MPDETLALKREREADKCGTIPARNWSFLQTGRAPVKETKKAESPR